MSNELAISDSPPAGETLRMQLMDMNVPQLTAALSEYGDRRKTFRDWLLSNMTEGVHYGYPPGCKPNIDPETGDALVWSQGKNIRIPKEQWRAKPSLYEAGADLLIDLLMHRSEFPAANDVHAQLGDVAGRFVFRCLLHDKSGKLVGEGIGASVCEDVGKRNGQGLNLAIKLAKKRAKVDAVKNTLGISDLFTQDTEDLDDNPTDPPQPKSNAAKAQPRGKRVTGEEIKALSARWVKKNPRGTRSDAEWSEEWFACVRKNGGPREDITNAGSWNREHVNAMESYFKLEGI